MGDISTCLEQTKTVSAIFAYHKEQGDAEPSRGYLGASIIGHSCNRYLWYCFRQCCKPDFSGRLYRLFETGDLAEIRFVKELRAIGCTVHEHETMEMQGQPSCFIQEPKQFEVSAHGGHFSGHMDGCALGVPEAPKTWHVLEFKTHNAKSFTKLKKGGVKESKPQHYAQMQSYMHLTGMKRALYLAVNKDTEELYSERVKYDATYSKALIDKAKQIITTSVPPERIASRPDYFECSWCDAREVCWGSPDSALPISDISCRQCCHATPMMDGIARWQCEKHKRSLSEGDQARACEDHLVLPGLIVFAEPSSYGVDEHGHDYIVFMNSESAHPETDWKHGRDALAFDSGELTVLPQTMLCQPSIIAAKRLFGATAEGFITEDVVAKFKAGGAVSVWKGGIAELREAWQVRYKEDLTEFEPIYRCKASDYIAAEFTGKRMAIVWTWVKQVGSKEKAEIMEIPNAET